ncbi:phosphatase PAP2 family protein [Ramlibacter sp. MMS24-I3-19]|uniref:phosphatase PAP2 family protein n=1 Tax=Ramlibacter sp. MMS24-I3-19 TaxID=3416606 RepID=UPI003D07FFA3
MSFPSLPSGAWHVVTRFGEAGILIPCALLLAGWLALATREWRTVLAWLLPLAAAVALTTASKIAFMGFGVGIASLDFTGFSGHSMFAAAVYPMLAHAATRRLGRGWRIGAVGLAYAFALAVAVSRVRLDAHSPSEVVLGFTLGAAASATALLALRHAQPMALPRVLAFGLAFWLAWTPREPVLLPSHAIVTRVSLKLSGRSVPYTRADLHRGRHFAS